MTATVAIAIIIATAGTILAVAIYQEEKRAGKKRSQVDAWKLKHRIKK